MYFIDPRGHLEGLPLARRSTPRTAILCLLRGSSDVLSTSIPKHTRLAELSIGGHTVRIRLQTPAREVRNADFYATAQIVYTLTSFSSISRVEPFFNGRHCCVSTMQGKAVPVLTRRTFANWQGVPLGP